MITENLRISFGALAANKLRTVLSVLGIMIGVLSVVLLLAMGSGAQAFVKKQIDAFGTNTVFLFPKSGNGGGGTLSRIPQITATDVSRVLDETSAINLAAPEVYMPIPFASVGGKTFSPRSVIGVDQNWAVVGNRRTQSGVLVSKNDVVRRARVAVIGETVAKRLFASKAVVGKTIRIAGQDFEVIGLYQRLGAGIDGDNDSVIHIPITTMSTAITGSTSYDSVNLGARSGLAAGEAERQIRRVLDQTHRITDPDKRDYDVFDAARVRETSGNITKALTALLGVIAGISLLVGGIGVMNIMLVTVTERTREIGIRKALGAKRGTLLTQFLIESIVLTGIGGAIGLAIGSALSTIKIGDFSPVLKPWMLVLAGGVSVGIGVVFGVYPANRAAKLRPIDALRFE
jgi:putative ABC transport system permease protein